MSRTSIKKLGSIANILSGFAFNSNCFGDGGDIPIIRIRDVVRGFSETYYTGDYSDTYVIDDGDLLIGMDGEFNTARWKGGKALLNQRVCKINPDPKSLDKDYLYYLLPKELKKIEDATPFVTVKHLSVKALQAIEIPLPPLEEQRRIAAILDKADFIRRKRKESILLMEEFLRSTFLDMFGDPVTNPKGWEIKKIEELCQLVRGSSPRPQGDARYYGGNVPRLMVADLTRDGWLVTPQIDSLTEEGAKLSRPIKAGTIVMAVSGNVGVVSQLAIDACIHDGFVAFKELNHDYVCEIFLMLCLHFMKQTHEMRKAGAIFQNLTTTDIKTMGIMVPPLPLQTKFSNIFIARHILQNKTENISNYAEDMCNSLTHRAFQGEL